MTIWAGRVGGGMETSELNQGDLTGNCGTVKVTDKVGFESLSNQGQ